MKKIISIIYFTVIFSILSFSQSALNSNLLSTMALNADQIKNFTIDITYEEIEFLEIYGNEIVIDLYGNNNLLLPEIITDLENNNILIKSSEKGKKATAGDICKISIYIPANSFFNNFSMKFENKPDVKICNIKGNNINIIDNSAPGHISNIFIENINGNLTAISNNGNINIKNCSGEYFSVISKTGNISCLDIKADYFDIKNKTGITYISLNTIPTGSSLISSKSGNVQLFVPSLSLPGEIQKENSGFNLDIHSTYGTFYNKLKNKRFSPRQGYSDSFLGGGAVIKIETVSGNIEVDEY